VQVEVRERRYRVLSAPHVVCSDARACQSFTLLWEMLGECMPIHTAPAVHGGRRRVDSCSPGPPEMLRSRNDDILPRFVQRSLQNPLID